MHTTLIQCLHFKILASLEGLPCAHYFPLSHLFSLDDFYKELLILTPKHILITSKTLFWA